jgi:hypothetical protein
VKQRTGAQRHEPRAKRPARRSKLGGVLLPRARRGEEEHAAAAERGSEPAGDAVASELPGEQKKARDE